MFLGTLYLRPSFCDKYVDIDVVDLSRHENVVKKMKFVKSFLV